MPTTVYTTLEDDTQMFYDKVLLVRALPALLYDKFGQQRPLQTRNTRKKLFRRYNALAVATTALVEGISPLGSSLAKTDVNVTLKQFGDFVTVTDVAQWASRDPVLTEAAEVLGEQAGQSLDQIYRDVVVAGTNVFVATDDTGGSSATRTDCDGLINAVFMDKLIRDLKMGNAKMFTKMIKASTGVGTTPIRAAFWGISHPEVEFTLEGVTGFKPRSDYPSGQEAMDPYEIGAYKNIRWCSTTHVKIALGGGNTEVAGHKATSSLDDVYLNMVFAQDGYGVVPMNGHALENIVKPLGSAGTADALNQRSTSGWKAMTNAVILNDDFMVRAETSAKT